jgi:uncharacterized membrane protein
VTSTAFPSRDDPAAAAASEWVGGPAGRYAVPSSGWWTPLRIALAVACAVLALGVISKQPCHDMSWETREDRTVWTSLCYSDVPFLYHERGFAAGSVAYLDTTDLEYPVVTGAVMQISAYGAQVIQSVLGPDTDNVALAEGVRFYEITTLLMALSALVVVVATARTVPRRQWDALLVAASPVLLLSATINWDLLAVAATSVAILAWTRERPVWAGVLIGLGTAAKLYPVLLLGVILLVALRAPDRLGALRRCGLASAGALLTWTALNAPVAALSWTGWTRFFTFNAERGAEFGSIWYALQILAPDLLHDDIDRLVVGAGLITLGLIIVLAMVAPEPPRLAQLAFLAVAAFLLVNKVWSPQYTLWLLPLAVLARPRWRELLIWQAAEVVYFVCIWFYLAGFYDPDSPMISAHVYAWSILLRVAALLWLAFVVIRDILRPERDPART